jgi:hypothetical protein
VDEMRDINIIEWNKKRKLQGFQLDLVRPKHKCRVESSSSSSEDESMIDESPVLESANNHTVNSRTDAAFLDDSSEHESAKDSNSFIEDSDTSMSVNDDAKLEADCANTYLSGNLPLLVLSYKCVCITISITKKIKSSEIVFI